MGTLAATLPDKYSPLQPNGNGNQGVYLAPVPTSMAEELSRLLKGQIDAVVLASPVADNSSADIAENIIKHDDTIPVTVREQLVIALSGLL